MNLRSLLFPLVLLLLCASALPALAGGTRSFVLDSAQVLAEGKLEGTAVTSDGSITAGVGTRRIELAGVPIARSLLVLPDGTAYVGTGNEGKVYVVKDGAARELADTKQLMVSALATDGRGRIFAGTMPKGAIYLIDASGKAQEWSSPQGAEHIWALVYDEAKKTLFAATGPEGKIFAIDDKGKAEVYYDSDAAHVMTLARDGDGTLYAGTSDQAVVLRLRGAGRAEVVHDFEGNEITALAVRNGELAVAANLFPKAPASKPQSTGGTSDANSPQASTNTSAAPTPPGNTRPQPGKGRLYRIGRDSRAEHLFTSEQGHITAVEWGEGGVIYAATGKDGLIHRIAPDRTHAVWIDVDERQVLAMTLSGKRPAFVTGDAGAFYEVLTSPPREATWTSKVLDGEVHSRWGQLVYRGQGKITLQTRSGNTSKPDASWTEWSSPLTAAGPIRSPSARFLQVRATLDTKTPSMIYAIEAFYLPQNRPATVTEIAVEPPRPKQDKPGAQRTPVGSAYKLKWKTENPDGDTLRARISYREERSKTHRSLVRESDVLTSSEYTWETDGIPDGYYRVRVEVSDELDNTEGTTLKSARESEPFLVDNRPPRFQDVRVQNGRITGKAQDNLGPISRLEYSVNGLEWKHLFPEDELFDTAEERFALPLAHLPKGNHVIVLRATDARGNAASTEIEIDVP